MNIFNKIVQIFSKKKVTKVIEEPRSTITICGPKEEMVIKLQREISISTIRKVLEIPNSVDIYHIAMKRWPDYKPPSGSRLYLDTEEYDETFDAREHI